MKNGFEKSDQAETEGPEQQEKKFTNTEWVLATEAYKRRAVDNFVSRVRSAQSDEEASKFIPGWLEVFKPTEEATFLAHDEFAAFKEAENLETYLKRRREKEQEEEKMKIQRDVKIVHKIRSPQNEDDLLAGLMEAGGAIKLEPSLQDVISEGRLRRQQNSNSELVPLPKLESLSISQYRMLRLMILAKLYFRFESDRRIFKAAIVMGSTARGNAGEKSDVDLYLIREDDKPLSQLDQKSVQRLQERFVENFPDTEVQFGISSVAANSRAARFITRKSSKRPEESPIWKFIYVRDEETRQSLNKILEEARNKK
jgi:predicted nucleotidyltransferase